MSFFRSAFLTFCLCIYCVVAHAQSGGFENHKFNGTKPVKKNGVYTFELQEGKCGATKYGDGRGESDCANGAYRSVVKAKRHAKVGRSYEYSFEFKVDPSFSYNGGRTPETSRIKISEWGRVKGIKNHIYEIHLDTVRGATFERKVCVPPSKLSQWNRFTLKIKWSKGNDGYLQAFCNDKLVLQRMNTQTVIPPDCGKPWKLQCKLEHQQPDADILWLVGPHMSGYGTTYRQIGKPSQFPPFPKSGVTVQARKLYFGRIRK